MHPLRLVVLGIAIALIGLTIWAFLRLLSDVCMLAGRGVRSLFGCGRRVQAGPRRDVCLRVGVPFATARRVTRQCENPKCRWENRGHARFCAHCGRPLSAARDVSVA
jgi:hypothetical protein